MLHFNEQRTPADNLRELITRLLPFQSTIPQYFLKPITGTPVQWEKKGLVVRSHRTICMNKTH